MRRVPVASFAIGPEEPLVLISGPCVIESETHALRCAEFLVRLCAEKQISLIFKTCYDKANRSSGESFRGPGREQGLRILEKIKTSFGVPLLTDIHSPEEAAAAAAVCDVIQIPAFLCRQTDLILAAGKTGAVVNVKKGQFMSPRDMKHVVAKLESTGNSRILLTERGTCFGYNNLVNDFRAIPIMQSLGYPVVFDATHSVQLPGGLKDRSGGEREFVPVLAAAALAAGCNALFAESHDDPTHAKSDADVVLPFTALPALLDAWKRLYEVARTCHVHL